MLVHHVAEKDSIPKPPEFLKLQSDVVNKSQNNIPITAEEIKSLVSASLGSGWIKLHPESLENIPANITSLQQLKPGLPPEIANNQNDVGKRWDAPNWNGVCDELAKLAKPTLVITGTDDDRYQPYVNSLKIVEKIPGAWLVQIQNAGHAVMDQYPDEISKILQTFLSTTTNQPNLSKKVYQRSNNSKFKNANYAASDHAGLGGGQELSWYSGD